MLKTLKVTVVLLFVLSVTALVLGILLFNRRQILLGRTLVLERGITMMAATLEERFPTAPEPLSLIPRDIDSVAPEAIDTPRTGDFWESYEQTLEVAATDTIRLANRRRELQSFFKLDPVTQKPLRDPITRERIRTGPGTTQGVLDDVVGAAEHQLNRLNETRHQLVDLRKECLDATDELNSRKRELRSALCQIVDRDGQITSLQKTITSRDETIAERDDQLADLNGRLLDSEHIVAIQIEDIEHLSNNVAIWQGKYETLLGLPSDTTPKIWAAMEPGYKGKIASVDPARDFVVMELTDTFLTEYKQALSRDIAPSSPTLMVTRKQNGQDVFIAKVELGTINVSQGLAVGSILASWQQDAILVNDAIIY
jgi:hypothetical protein